MPLGGLRSSVVGSLHADSEFLDADNLRRERSVNIAGDDKSETSNVALVASNLVEIRSENPALGTFNPGTKEGAAIFKLKKRMNMNRKSI